MKERHGAEYFIEKVNAFCSNASVLSNDNVEYDIQIRVVNNSVKEIKRKLQNTIALDTSASLTDINQGLIILLEDKLNELLTLNEKNEEVKQKMEETLVAYEDFIRIQGENPTNIINQP